MKAALLGDLAEFGKSSVQTPIEFLTFVKGGCRVFVQGCLGTIVGVIVDGDPGLFSGAGCCVKIAECKIEWAKAEPAKASVATPSM